MVKKQLTALVVRFTKEQKIEHALKAYQKLNPVKNDTEAYLYSLGEWALDDMDEKPNCEDFWVEEDI